MILLNPLENNKKKLNNKKLEKEKRYYKISLT